MKISYFALLGMVSGNVPALQEVANFGTDYFRLRYYFLRNANLNLLDILPFLVTAVNPRFSYQLENTNFANFHFGFQTSLSIFWLFSEKDFKANTFLTFIFLRFDFPPTLSNFCFGFIFQATFSSFAFLLTFC